MKCWDHRRECSEFSGSGEEDCSSANIGFSGKFAKQMMINNLDDDGIHCQSPIRAQKWLSEPSLGEHDHLKRPKFTGSWDERLGTWSNVCTKYLKTRCSICSSDMWMYCSCNKKVSMYVKAREAICLQFVI